ncbi:hypothetical protein SDC9_145889 [bioreactor metagenome]|uniref:Uncharacterized protein n=1 Tax=bioreactor metagenome TaxID=1076179 RepID=A0A645EBJ8_9ZZZZ
MAFPAREEADFFGLFNLQNLERVVQFGNVDILRFHAGHGIRLIRAQANGQEVARFRAVGNHMRIRCGSDARNAHELLVSKAKRFLFILRNQKNRRRSVGNGAHIELPQRVGHDGIGGVDVGGVGDALQHDRALNMRNGVMAGVVVVFDGYDRKILALHAELIHAEAREQARERRQRAAVFVFRFRMQHGCNEVRAFPAAHFAHAFAADDQNAVAHAGCNGHDAQLHGGSAGGGAVFHGLRHRGANVERIDNRAGRAADAADHAGAH